MAPKDHLAETFDDVAALIPRYSWEIMDEGQRDDLMEKIILPRYMKTTADGFQLGPKMWAEMVGATSNAIQKRVERLRSSQMSDEDAASSTERDHAKRAKHALSKASPKTSAKVIKDLPPKQRLEIRKALSEKDVAEVEEARKRQAKRDEADPQTQKLKRLGAVLDVEKDLSGVLTTLSRSLELSFLPHTEQFGDKDREEFAAELQEIIDVANGYKTIITTGDESLAEDVLGFAKDWKKPNAPTTELRKERA